MKYGNTTKLTLLSCILALSVGQISATTLSEYFWSWMPSRQSATQLATRLSLQWSNLTPTQQRVALATTTLALMGSAYLYRQYKNDPKKLLDNLVQNGPVIIVETKKELALYVADEFKIHLLAGKTGSQLKIPKLGQPLVLGVDAHKFTTNNKVRIVTMPKWNLSDLKPSLKFDKDIRQNKKHDEKSGSITIESEEIVKQDIDFPEGIDGLLITITNNLSEQINLAEKGKLIRHMSIDIDTKELSKDELIEKIREIKQSL
jgi:hypothetical protein